MQETNKKIMTYLGFSMRSKEIVYGLDNIQSYRKKQFLIILCTTITEKNELKMKTLCEHKNIALVKLKSGLLAELLNKENVKLVSVTNFELAKAIFANDENFEIIKRGIF